MAEKHHYDEVIENQLSTIILDNELESSRSNNIQDTADFEASIDLLENVRNEKNYDWRSNISIPEFASIHLTDASIMANQYFSTRDYVNVYLEDDKPEAKIKCRAVKKCINEALNNPKIYHYQKYMRARITNSLYGMVWLKCWWDKDKRKEVTGYEQVRQELDVDELGNEIVDPINQVPATQVIDKPVVGDVIYVDRFNYDVIDPRNVFTDSKYCYSAQEKDFIIVRSEMTYEEIKDNEEKNGYINLDLLKPIKPQTESETSQETYNKNVGKGKPDKTVNKPFDVYERFGKFWVVRDKNGFKPGIDESGVTLKNAELVEMIITFAKSADATILIRFQECPYRTKKGLHYRPLIRGICYIHPTKDTGMSDGKYARDLNVAINDTFNISNDRVQLATLPVMKARKYALEDNSTIYIAPEHVIELENPREDLEMLEISDNIQGALAQMNVLTGKMQQVTSIYPTTMGEVGQASTTATAVAGSESRTNMRTNYKSLTVEYTMNCEMYWMVIQMAWQFAEAETAFKMMGEDVYSFDPEDEYTYIPLTQNIEAEQSKYRKLQTIDQFIGRLAAVPNPKTFALINKLISKAFDIMGDEYTDYRDALLDESAPPPLPAGASGAAPQQIPEMGGMGVSNQNMIPQSGQEMMVRGGVMGMR
jgi:hypothetical protein